MPNTPKDVKLNISTTPKNENGWKSTTASNHIKYWYKYIGGNKAKGNGDQDCDADQLAVTFDIDFQGGDEEKYNFVSFYKDPATDQQEQLSGVVSDNKKTITVTDQCTAVSANMVYGGVVQAAGNTAVQFTCDPVISNKQVDL